MIEAIHISGLDKIEDLKRLRSELIGNHDYENIHFERLMDEEHADHVVVYEADQPIATGFMTCMNSRYEIRQIYVIQEQRRRGYGDLIVKMLIDKAFKMGANEVCVFPNEVCGLLFQKVGFVVDTQTEYLFIRQNMIKRCKG